jgi:hypothetical protein
VLQRCIDVFRVKRLNVFNAKTSCCKLVKVIASQLNTLNKKAMIDRGIYTEMLGCLHGL